METKTSELKLRHQVSLRELIGLLDYRGWKKLAFWALISTLTTGFPASVESFINKLQSNSLALGFDELFTQTAPLIWSVAVVAFACHRGWLTEGGLIPSAAFILLGGWLGHFLQHGGAVVPVDWLPTDRYALLGSVVFAALNLLMAYFLTYGAAAFIASVLVGSALGVAWSRWLLKLQEKYAAITLEAKRSQRKSSSESESDMTRERAA